jgi:hypothetical protein
MTEPAFAPNVYARCECELTEEFGNDPADYPICTFFEAVPDDDCPDCCKACRHGERCHLKGHRPASTCVCEISRLQPDNPPPVCSQCEIDWLGICAHCCHDLACHTKGEEE